MKNILFLLQRDAFLTTTYCEITRYVHCVQLATPRIIVIVCLSKNNINLRQSIISHDVFACI